MVEVTIQEGASATVDGVSYTGPLHLFGDAMSAPASFDKGYVVVHAGGANRTLPYTALETQLMPLILCGLFVLGLLWSRCGAR